MVGAEASQRASTSRVIHSASCRSSFCPGPHPAVDLRRQDDLVAAHPRAPCPRSPLGLTGRVDVGRVDEVDPRVERLVHDPDARVDVGVPATSRASSRAEAVRADADAGGAERSVFHGSSCWVPSGGEPLGQVAQAERVAVLDAPCASRRTARRRRRSRRSRRAHDGTPPHPGRGNTRPSSRRRCRSRAASAGRRHGPATMRTGSIWSHRSQISGISSPVARSNGSRTVPSGSAE